MFQSIVAHHNPTKKTIVSIDAGTFNVLSPKYSLCDTIDQCLSNIDHLVLQKYLTGVLINQITSKSGVKKHVDEARDALFAKFPQFHDMNVLMPINKKYLTREQIKGTLRAMSIINKKCHDHDALKGRTCAVGTPQRELYLKYETSSPVIHADSFVHTTVIESKERR